MPFEYGFHCLHLGHLVPSLGLGGLGGLGERSLFILELPK
jgi:hypothetical protein